MINVDIEGIEDMVTGALSVNSILEELRNEVMKDVTALPPPKANKRVRRTACPTLARTTKPNIRGLKHSEGYYRDQTLQRNKERRMKTKIKMNENENVNLEFIKFSALRLNCLLLTSFIRPC